MTDTTAGEALRKASSLCDEYRRAATGDGDPEKTLWAVDALIDQASEALAAQPSAGAQGEAETLRVLLDNLVISQSLSRALREKATDDARSYLYDLRQKPSGHTSKCWGRTSYSDEVVHCYCATPAKPDTGDVAALREALEKIVSEADGYYGNGSEYDAGIERGLGIAGHIAEQALAALSTANTQGGA